MTLTMNEMKDFYLTNYKRIFSIVIHNGQTEFYMDNRDWRICETNSCELMDFFREHNQEVLCLDFH